MIARVARTSDGFGLIELVIAIAVLNVVILALFATLNAGSLALQRASRISTAETVADKQMELYRAHLYKNIALHNGHIAAASSDATHTADPAWVSAGAQFSDPLSICNGSVDECKPVQTGVTGADGRTYRVDTYIRQLTAASGGPASGQPVKRVTVVVRDSQKVLARLTSTFHNATGCTGSNDHPCSS